MIDVMRTVHGAYAPASEPFGTRLETYFIALCVALGDIDGKPFSVAKIASYMRVPRTTVIRRLNQLQRWGLMRTDGALIPLQTSGHRSSPRVITGSRAATGRRMFRWIPSFAGSRQSGKVSKTVNSSVAWLGMRRTCWLLLHVTLNCLVGPKRKRKYEWQASAWKNSFRPEHGQPVEKEVSCLTGKACGFSVCSAATSVC